MAEELKACGKNGYGETFWKLCVPDEHCSPGLEVGISAGERGLTIGGRLLNWAELDQSRAQLHSQGGEAVATLIDPQGRYGFCVGAQDAERLAALPSGTKLYTHPADQVTDPLKQIAWERRAGVMGCKRFMTQKVYEAQSPQMKGNYEPFYCAHCKADQAAEPDTELVELLDFLRDTLMYHRWAWEGDAISRIDSKLDSLK